MENIPLISILIPTYNRSNYLKECLDSILCLDWFNENDIEIIISDNCSTDDTENIVKNLKKNNIIYYKNNKNIWGYKNVDKICQLKKWKYFIFISDDDKFYNKNSLKILYDNLIKYNLDACYWITECFNKDKTFILKSHENKVKEYIHYDNFKEQLKYNTMCFWWMLYKDNLINHDVNTKQYIDWDYNLQYLNKGLKIWMINKKTFLYRFHDEQDSHNINYDTFYLTMYIYKKYKIWKYHYLTYLSWCIAWFFLKFLKDSYLFKKTYKSFSNIWKKFYIKK